MARPIVNFLGEEDFFFFNKNGQNFIKESKLLINLNMKGLKEKRIASQEKKDR